MVVQNKKHIWGHLCKRAPEFFDTSYSGAPKGYGKFILGQMLQIVPEGDSGKAKVRLMQLLAKIDAVVLPVCATQEES